MLDALHKRKKVQLLLGLIIGICFGFLLEKGGVTSYDIIISQLLLRNFRVFKVIFSAIIVGMVGIYTLKSLKKVNLHIKPCFPIALVVGGLIFGVGFALLGYCPGTSAGSAGTGSIHALVGMLGILLGAGIYAHFYPSLRKRFMRIDMGNKTIPELLGINSWIVVTIFVIVILLSLIYIEYFF